MALPDVTLTKARFQGGAAYQNHFLSKAGRSFGSSAQPGFPSSRKPALTSLTGVTLSPLVSGDITSSPRTARGLCLPTLQGGSHMPCIPWGLCIAQRGTDTHRGEGGG